MITDILHRCFSPHRWLTGAFALALAGCSVGPDYQAPDLPKPAAWRNSAAPAALWPASDWWHSFGSEPLDRYIASAQAANNDLAAAAARMRQADAQARIAGAALLPSVGLTAGATHERQNVSGAGPQTSTGYNTGVTASYEIDFWGKNAAALDAARQTALASRFDAATVALTVTTGVATTYFQIIELRDRLAVADDNLTSARTTLKGLQQQEQAGISTGLDVAQQETVVAGLEAAIPPLRQQLGQSIDALAILIGQTPESVDPGPATLADLTRPEIGAGLPSALLARRPDVAEAEAQLIAANANIKVAQAAFYPSIELTASGGLASAALSNLLKPGNALYALSAGLTQPIFEGGALQGQLELSQARYDELLADYRKAVLAAFGNTEDALLAVRQTAEQERRQQSAVTTARRAYDFARLQMNAGTVNILTVLNTETALFSAQDALVQAKFLHLQALVGLYSALGGGWQKA